MNLHRIHTILSIVSGGALIATVVLTARMQTPLPLSVVPQVAAVVAHEAPIEEVATSTASTTKAVSSVATSTATTTSKKVPLQESDEDYSETPEEPTATSTQATSSDSFQEGIHAALTW